MIFSEQPSTDKKFLNEDAVDSERFIKNIPKIIYNFSRDNSISHMHPNNDKEFKQVANALISQINSLENYLFDFGKDTKANFKVQKSISNLQFGIDTLSKKS